MRAFWNVVSIISFVLNIILFLVLVVGPTKRYETIVNNPVIWHRVIEDIWIDGYTLHINDNGQELEYICKQYSPLSVADGTIYYSDSYKIQCRATGGYWQIKRYKKQQWVEKAWKNP